MFVKNRACRKCGTPDFVCRAEACLRPPGWIIAPAKSAHQAAVYHCHCEEGEARRGNLLEDSSTTYAVPGDSFASLGMTDLGDCALVWVRRSLMMRRWGHDPTLHISPGDGVPYGCISFRRTQSPTTAVIARSEATWQSVSFRFRRNRAALAAPQGLRIATALRASQ